MENGIRPCWQNCVIPDDEHFLNDEERAEIDAMEDAIAPLDEQTARIRQLITSFESCYHEADKQAELIIKAIAAGQAPTESEERPRQRKTELQNTCDILSAWCEDRLLEETDLDVGGKPANELISLIGDRTDLKGWQVRRVVEKVTFALDATQPYHNMALNVGEYGEPGQEPVDRHYKDHQESLSQTTATVIHDTIDGRKAQISLAMAVDRLQPCSWNFVENLVIILKAIGGDLHPDKPFACCERNVLSTPLRSRLEIISNSLRTFWQADRQKENIDGDILTLLGADTTVKRWLGASLDKTISLQLDPVNVRRMSEWVETPLK